MKRKLCAAVCACLLLAGCGKAQTENQETVVQTIQTETTEETKSPNIEKFEAAKAEIETRLGSGDSFCYSNVEYDSESFTTSVSMNGMWDMVSNALAHNIRSDSDQWESIRKSTTTGYELTKKILEDSGADLANVKVCFDLVSDVDPENVLVSVVDGTVYYDVLETMEAMVDSGTANPTETISESDKTLLSLITEMMQSNFGNCTVELENGKICVAYSYPGLTNLEAGFKAESEDVISGWDKLVAATVEIQQGVCDVVKEYGADYQVTLMLLDDEDNNKKLLVITDGEVVYNIADNL